MRINACNHNGAMQVKHHSKGNTAHFMELKMTKFTIFKSGDKVTSSGYDFTIVEIGHDTHPSIPKGMAEIRGARGSKVAALQDLKHKP